MVTGRPERADKQTDDQIERAVRMIGALYRGHRDIDDLVQVARLAAWQGMQKARARSEAEGRTYTDPETTAFVRRAILTRVHDWVLRSANRPFYQLMAEDDIHHSPITPPMRFARQTATARLTAGEMAVLDAIAARYNVSRSRVLRTMASIGFAALAALAEDEGRV